MGFITKQEPATFLSIESRQVINSEIGIFLPQRRFAETVLERFGTNGCKPVNSRTAPDVKPDYACKVLPEKNEHAAMVGSKLYLNKSRLHLCSPLDTTLDLVEFVLQYNRDDRVPFRIFHQSLRI
jgi:hypothetical protein